MTESVAEGALKENFSASDYLDAEKELTDFLNKIGTLQGRYQAARKKWKGRGLVLGDFDAIQKLKRLDEQDVRDSERTRQKYAKWAGLDLGFQAAFDFEPLAAEDQQKRDKNNTIQLGFLAGKRGDPRLSNPFADDPGNIGYAAWDEGWSQGDTDAFNSAAPQPARQPTKGQGPEAGGGRKRKAKDAAPEAKHDEVPVEQHSVQVGANVDEITGELLFDEKFVDENGNEVPDPRGADDPLEIPAFLKRTQ